MACQTLESSVAQNARPSGDVAEDGRPQTCAPLCRQYDVGADNTYLVTFVNLNPIKTFAGNAITALA